MAITFDEAMHRFKPYLPRETRHFQITPRLRLYRAGNDYLSVEVDKVDIDYHRIHEDRYIANRAAQVQLEDAFSELDRYEESQKPVELTLKEVAEKFGVDVDKLRIKE